MKMSLWKIAYRSVQQRALASGLTAISMALGVMLVVAVLLIYGIVDQSFRSNSSLGYNMIVGAKGGKLQLVLNTVYHLSSPVENIPYSFYQEFLPGEERKDGKKGKYSPYVKFAIPLCLGDYYENYRVVGTTPEMFDDFVYDLDYGRKYEFSDGRNFKTKSEEHGFFESVIGSTVARKTGLKPGDTFEPSCGAVEGKIHAPFTVVGILKPTGTPNDRAIFINIEGFYLLDGHAKPVDSVDPYEQTTTQVSNSTSLSADKVQQAESEFIHPHQRTEPLPIEQREVTALLVRASSLIVVPGLQNNINEGVHAQAVLPMREITSLFESIVRPIQMVLLTTFGLVCIVSGVGILVSIYNSMSERRHEIAVMRALGAGRNAVMLIVLLESIILALGGGSLGWFAGHLLVAGASPWIEFHTGVSISLFDFAPGFNPTGNPASIWNVSSELLLIPALMVLAVAVGFLPAVSAYKTDVGDALSSSP